MKRWVIASVIVWSVVAGTRAGAVEWGVRGTVFVGDIFASGLERNTTIVSQGGRGVSIVHSAVDDQVALDTEGDGPHSRGRADAAAAIRPRAHAPALLQAEAITFDNTSNKPFQGTVPDGAVVGATAFSSDLFEYIGTERTTLTLHYEMLSRIVNLPADLTGRSGIALQVAVLANTPEYRFLDHLSTLVQEEGATLLDTTRVMLDEDSFGDDVLSTLSLSFDVTPGQTFYVWQKLTTTAVRGGRVSDAFAPVLSSFDQPEFVRSRSLVPEPTAAALLVTGAMFMIVNRRRRIPGRVCAQ